MIHYYYTISLGRHSFVCDHRLFTKTLTVHLPEPYGLNGKFRFPRVHIIDANGEIPIVELIHPIPWEKIGIEHDSSFWGNVTCWRYMSKDNRRINYRLYTIKAFTIDIESHSHLEQSKIDSIKQFIMAAVDRAIGIMAIKNPESINTELSPRKHKFVGGCDVSYLQENGRNMNEIGGTAYIHGMKQPVNFSLIKYLLRNAGKNLTLQYDFLLLLKQSLNNGDYRSCVLYAATIIETVLGHLIENYFLSHNVPNEVKNHIYKHLNGISAHNELIKKFNIEQCRMPQIEEISSLRNKVIHKGYKVTNSDGEKAFDTAYSFLQFYEWQIFE